MDALWRVCEHCVASVRSALRHGKRSNEGTYYSAFENVACGRGERALHFLGMIAFG